MKMKQLFHEIVWQAEPSNQRLVESQSKGMMEKSPHSVAVIRHRAITINS